MKSLNLSSKSVGTKEVQVKRSAASSSVVVAMVAVTAITVATPLFARADAAPAAQSNGLLVEVKQWARVQWHSIKTYWYGAPAGAPAVAKAPVLKAPPGKAVAGQPGAAGGAAPQAASGTRSLSAPPNINPTVGSGTTGTLAANPAAKPVLLAPPVQQGLSVHAPANAASASSPSMAAPAVTAPGVRKLVAPSAPSRSVAAVPEAFQDREYIEVAGLKKSDNGVPVYDLASNPKVPRLSIGLEDRVKASQYKLDLRMQKIVDERIITAFDSPENLNVSEFKRLTNLNERAKEAQLGKDVVFAPKGRVSRQTFDKIVMLLKNEPKINIGKFKYLSADEVRFLSGLLLYQQGDKCASAVGLFHKLSQSQVFATEANYYLSMCSKKLGLMTDYYERARRVFDGVDQYYSVKLLKDIGHDVPYEFVDGIGAAVLKLSAVPKFMDQLDPALKANIAYILTDYGASTDRFKTTLAWAKQVPVSHPKYLNAQFLLALAEYQVGSKEEAFRIQDKLINDVRTDKTKMEFPSTRCFELGPDGLPRARLQKSTRFIPTSL